MTNANSFGIERSEYDCSDDQRTFIGWGAFSLAVEEKRQMETFQEELIVWVEAMHALGIYFINLDEVYCL